MSFAHLKQCIPPPPGYGPDNSEPFAREWQMPQRHQNGSELKKKNLGPKIYFKNSKFPRNFDPFTRTGDAHQSDERVRRRVPSGRMEGEAHGEEGQENDQLGAQIGEQEMLLPG